MLPGAWGGLPWLFALGCLVVIPVAVYILSYTPWIALGNQWYRGNPAGNTGQTLWDLTLSMYDYHNNLRVGHPASSPWWAWPLDLKPVWFFQQSFANGTLGDIYDSGNLVIFWMSIPAMLFATVAAWRRRSLPLTIVVLMFLAMWLPWVRIDRATFQYHYYSSLPFLVLALAYFLAELWHGPAHLAWVLARVGGALAILAPPLLWLSRQPLVHPGRHGHRQLRGAGLRSARPANLGQRAGTGGGLRAAGRSGRRGVGESGTRRARIRCASRAAGWPRAGATRQGWWPPCW